MKWIKVLGLDGGQGHCVATSLTPHWHADCCCCSASLVVMETPVLASLASLSTWVQRLSMSHLSLGAVPVAASIREVLAWQVDSLGIGGSDSPLVWWWHSRMGPRQSPSPAMG